MKNSEENMSLYKLEGHMRRAKSMGDLNTANTHCIDLNCAKSFPYSTQKPHDSYEILLDSLNTCHRKVLDLKRKNLKLRDLVKQQQSILDFIKNDTKLSYRKIIASFVEESTKTLSEIGQKFDDTSEKAPNKKASSLLAAIEPKSSKPDGKIKDALTKLTKTFQKKNKIKDEKTSPCPKLLLKKRKPVKEMQGSESDSEWNTSNQEIIFPENDAKDLESLEDWCKSSMKTKNASCNWGNELKGWNKLPKILLPLLKVDQPSIQTDLGSDIGGFDAEEPKVPASPPQPTDPNVSIIDHLMQSAIINKKISEGDFNGSFEEALSHCNLALVMGACRAADPSAVFSPCSLSQAVLMSLVQQLATDMVHETQLKCRYLEEALINLDVSNKVTQTHLPLVVEEIRKHLTKFVRAYPHHIANRRISLIVMAADNLIK